MKGFEWVHCNKCLFDVDAAAQANRGAFNLTTCGHVVCDTCLQQQRAARDAPSSSCPVCEASCKVVQLRGQLPVDVEALFSDPALLLASAGEVEAFQRRQLTALVAQLRALVGKQVDTLQKARDELVLMRQVQSHAEQLKEKNERLEAHLATLREENDRLAGRAPSADGRRGAAPSVSSVLSKLASSRPQSSFPHSPFSASPASQSPFNPQSQSQSPSQQLSQSPAAHNDSASRLSLRSPVSIQRARTEGHAPRSPLVVTPQNPRVVGLASSDAARSAARRALAPDTASSTGSPIARRKPMFPTLAQQPSASRNPWQY